MDNPQSLLDALEKALSDWQKLGRRAQLEAVMPMLEVLAKRKVGYAALADLLRAKGLDIKPDSLRQALHRWRKKQALPPTEEHSATLTSSASQYAAQGATVAVLSPSAKPPAPLPVSNPATGAPAPASDQSGSVRNPRSAY